MAVFFNEGKAKVMKFHEVASYFEEIDKESSRLKITRLLAELLKKATPSEAAIISYLSLGELNPVYIGTQFNFAEKSLVKVLAKLLNCSERHIQHVAAKEGDLGLVLEREGYSPKIKDHLTRIVGFFTPVSAWSKQRREWEFSRRIWNTLKGDIESEKE